MFGYIKAYKPELKVKEYERYRAVYCSLCKELGRSFSVFARFTLSYDFVFVALLSMALEEEELTVTEGRCAFNPLVKCRYVQTRGESFRLAANAAAILLYYKGKDDLQDSGFFRKLAVGALFPLLFLHRLRARHRYPLIDELAADYMRQQRQVEQMDDPSIDRAAHPTAWVLQQLFRLLSEEETRREHLGRMGYCLGRWVYLMDAIDDLEQDEKKQRFNPFSGYGSREETKDYARGVLTLSAGEAHQAFDRLALTSFHPILDNILLLGLEAQQQLVLQGDTKHRKGRRSRRFQALKAGQGKG